MSLAAPSKAQIALALIVLKSRPVDLSIEAYIDLIRAVVIRRKRKETTNNHHYIDGTLFWKQAFHRIEDENSKLTTRIFELEQALEQTKGICPSASAPAKRKAESTCTAKANTQSKRRKIEAGVTGDIGQPAEAQLQSSLPGHRKLLQAFYRIRLDLSKSKISAGMLCQSIRLASYSAGQAIACLYREKVCQITPQITVLEDGLKFVIVLWKTLLEAIQKIKTFHGEACIDYVSSMTYLFQELLGQLQQYCLDEAGRQLKHKRTRRAKTNSASTVGDGPTQMQKRDFETICGVLSETLCQILFALDPASVVHCAILEGLLCALLDHIGSSISLLVFADPSTSMAKQEGIVAPRGLLDVAHIDSESAYLTNQLAAPYLVRLLRVAMGIVDGLQSASQRRLIRIDASPSVDNASLVAKVKIKLQKTLLRGIYGDEDAKFKDALQRAPELDLAEIERLLESNTKDLDQSEWFFGQVWEYVGWDIVTADW